MVTGYTASDFGDYIIASVKEPYLNTTQVLEVSILAGVQNQTTIGKVNITAGSQSIIGINTDFTKLNQGDQIILGNTQFEIESIQAQNELTVTEAPDFSTQGLDFYLPVDNNNYFEYQYRWSHSNEQFSEFQPLNNNTDPDAIKTLVFDSTKPLYIDTKAEVAALSAGHTISLISITFTLQTEEGTIESCPQFCVECTDPFIMEGCANIEVSCDAGTFNPYELTKTATIYKQLVNITNNIFGHEVTYFRTEPDARTEDVILMEYSLHDVVDKNTIKILVPDNEFPTEANTYDIFGMEFAEFEIHIVSQEFENVFGAGTTPRNMDYMYIPIINKMYEVESISLADEFNRENSYWRVKLVKYQDRTSVNKGTFEEDTDSFVTGVEEVFGERQTEEFEKNTKPTQFQTVSTAYRDGVRSFINRQLGIIDHDLKNRWTIVSKNYYDLKNVELNSTALEYEVQSKLQSNQNLAVTLWFQPQFNNNDTGEYMLFGDLAALGGFKMFLSNNTLKLIANDNVYEFQHNIQFTTNWYGLVLNINNTSLQLNTAIYKLDPSANYNNPQNSSNDLVESYHETKNIGQPLMWNTESNYHLRGNMTYMTNIRVFSKVIEWEQHHNILNQYVVRDNHLAHLIDNAIPSLGYQKFYNAR